MVDTPSLLGGLLDPVKAAESAIRSYCGWHVSPVIEQTVVLDHFGGARVMLPSRRVVNVSRVVVGGVEVPSDGYSWSADGWLDFNCSVPRGNRSIEVTMEHGYAPDHAIAQVVNSVVTRARMSPAGNVVSQRAGTQSVVYASSSGEVASFPLMQSEKDLLTPYKLTWGPY